MSPPKTDPSGSSPHTRGALVQADHDLIAERIIPAYAGSTKTLDYGICHIGDHPRIRGEHKDAYRAIARAAGSSPHTRGALTKTFSPPRAARDHPRIRGEHLLTVSCRSPREGSSPHTRGAPPQLVDEPPRTRIIPAYAGSTLGNPCNTKDRRRDYTSFPLPVTHPSGGGGS